MTLNSENSDFRLPKKNPKFQKERGRLPALSKRGYFFTKKKRPHSSVMKRKLDKAKIEEIEKVKFIREYLAESNDKGIWDDEENVGNFRYGAKGRDEENGIRRKIVQGKRIRPLTGMSKISKKKLKKIDCLDLKICGGDKAVGDVKEVKLDQKSKFNLNCKPQVLELKIEFAENQSKEVRLNFGALAKCLKSKPKKKVIVKELHSMISSNNFELKIHAQHNKGANKKLKKLNKTSKPKKLQSIPLPTGSQTRRSNSDLNPDLYRLSHPFLDISKLLKNFFEKSKHKGKSKKYICFFSSQDFHIPRVLKK
jgi:hypothetical protein